MSAKWFARFLRYLLGSNCRKLSFNHSLISCGACTAKLSRMACASSSLAFGPGGRASTATSLAGGPFAASDHENFEGPARRRQMTGQVAKG